MILNHCNFYNKYDQEIEMLPIVKFLFDHPDYGKHLADVIEFWESEGAPIAATRIQRKCMIRYGVADSIMKTLLFSKVAVRLHDPARIEVWMCHGEAMQLCEAIRNFTENRTPEEEARLLRQVLNRAYDMNYGPRDTVDEDTEKKYNIYRGHLNYYPLKDEDVVLPQGVIYLNRYSFSNNEMVKSITFPAGLLVVDDSVFRGCINLERVSLSDTVKQLGPACFWDCVSLKEIIMPDSIEQIGVGAFRGCSALSKVRLSENLSCIPNYAFFGCKNLEIVQIPSFVSTIYEHAFGDCDNLKLAYVPNDTVIEADVFPKHTKIIRI